MKLSKTIIAMLLTSTFVFCALVVGITENDSMKTVQNGYSITKQVHKKDYGLPSHSYRWFSGR